MEQTWLDELIYILSKEQWLFYYRKDDYARLLLSYYLKTPQPLRALKQSPYTKLLTKPSLKATLAQQGNGALCAQQIVDYGWATRHCYHLTLDTWGTAGTHHHTYQQTSRSGKNLVLQLNFSNQHNHPYHTLINPIHFHPFECTSHPIAPKPKLTMSWARIDIAHDLSHALIEEIQTDWLRDAFHAATWYWRTIRRNGQRQRVKQHCNETGVSKQAWQRYEQVLASHKKIWAEATLSAAIVLLKAEIGIDRIYYHTHNSGNILKGFRKDWAPPKSLYTKLPEQFCFRKTKEPPPMLEKHIEALQYASRRKEALLDFYLLDLA